MDRKRRMMSAQSTSVTQQLMDGAPFVAQLTKTLALQRGTGSATFTRATTGSVQDHEGVLRTAIAGEARFTGARGVRNWIQAPTENWSNSTWTKSSISASGNRLTATGANGVIYDSAALGMGTGRTALASVTLSRVTGTGNIDISTNGGITWTTVSVTGARVSVSLTGNINGQFVIRIVTSGDAIDATYPQLEDVTGRADQTTPSEYVSVGVASAPYYHGAGVDGVKYFDTDLSGNPLTTLKGYLAEGARTNYALWNRDLTNVVWVKTSCTAALTATGADSQNAANSASTLTATAGNATCLQSITRVSAQRVTGCKIKRRTGTGTINMTQDNGVTWTPVTVTSAYTNVAIPAATAANPIIGFQIVTNGDAIDVDFVMHEEAAFVSSSIATTTIAVARNSDVESVSTSGNITAAAGTVYLEFTPTHSPSGTIAFWGTYVDASNYTAILHDATNLIFRKRIAGINYDATIANAFVSGTTYKVCGTWGAAGVTITLNGTDGTPSADTTAAQIAATMQWGADGNSLQQPFASVRNGRDWLRQLSSSERRAITA